MDGFDIPRRGCACPQAKPKGIPPALGPVSTPGSDRFVAALQTPAGGHLFLQDEALDVWTSRQWMAVAYTDPEQAARAARRHGGKAIAWHEAAKVANTPAGEGLG